MVKLTKAELVFIICITLLAISNFLTYNYYNNRVEEKDKSYIELGKQKDELSKRYLEFENKIFYEAESNCTAVTIVYYTNFSQNRQIISFSVPYETYNASHTKNHPYWGIQNLTSASEYVSDNEPIIKQIVETIKNRTKSEEELANALLDFVQDKGQSLSIRYYPTTELKYPIETLVEMGGDCDTHSFLYGTLMKTAGFKVLILISNETLGDGQYHIATAIHLANPPEKSLPDYSDYYLTSDGEKYYYAETTNVGWRVGDLPPMYENVTFNSISI